MGYWSEQCNIVIKKITPPKNMPDSKMFFSKKINSLIFRPLLIINLECIAKKYFFSHYVTVNLLSTTTAICLNILNPIGQLAESCNWMITVTVCVIYICVSKLNKDLYIFISNTKNLEEWNITIYSTCLLVFVFVCLALQSMPY